MNKEELQKKNKNILDLQVSCIVRKNQIANGKVLLEKETTYLMNELELEKDDDGKKKYSNEAKRRLRIEELISENPTHKIGLLRDELAESGISLAKDLALLDFLVRELQILMMEDE